MTTPPETPTPSPAPADTAQKPPLKWLLAYRVLGLRLPREYRAWVAKDVTSKGFLTRRIGRSIAWAAFFLVLYYVAQSAIYEAPSLDLTWRNGMFRAALVALAACLLASGATLVRNTLRWQRIDRHGRAVKPKPKTLAIFENEHAVVFGALAIVLFMGASAIFADAFVVPDGPAGEKCRTPKEATMARIRAGLKDQSTEIGNAQEVRFGDSAVVSATASKTGAPRRAVFWIVTPNEVFEIAVAETITSYPPPDAVDRISGEAIRRVVECVADRSGGARR